jgi:hypothetical protein
MKFLSYSGTDVALIQFQDLKYFLDNGADFY